MVPPQGTPDFDTYTVFDPKLPAGRATLERAKGPFRWVQVQAQGLLCWSAGLQHGERRTRKRKHARSLLRARTYGTTGCLFCVVRGPPNLKVAHVPVEAYYPPASVS